MGNLQGSLCRQWMDFSLHWWHHCCLPEVLGEHVVGAGVDIPSAWPNPCSPHTHSLRVLPGILRGWVPQPRPPGVRLRHAGACRHPRPGGADHPAWHGGGERAQRGERRALYERGDPQRSYLRTVRGADLQPGQVCRILLVAGKWGVSLTKWLPNITAQGWDLGAHGARV